MKKYGFTKGNKHSNKDFGLKIVKREFNPPEQNYITTTIPFMNGSYNFSELYGGACYEDRTIKYYLDFNYRDKIEYFTKKTQITAWIKNNKENILYDDLFPGYYFVINESYIEFEESNLIDCDVIIKLILYPFMIGNEYEGNNIWDDFNFELDILQDTKFTVSGANNVNIYNSSAIDIEPIIIASSKFEIIKDNEKFVVEAGESKDYRFKLNKGDNNLTIKGNGLIEFKFRKEVL